MVSDKRRGGDLGVVIFKMVKFIKIIAIGISVFLLVWLADVHFFRGYYFNDLTFLFIDIDKHPSKIKFTYTVERMNSKNVKLTITNNDFAYRYIPCYREGMHFVDMNEWVFLFGTTLGILKSTGDWQVSNYDIIDCGTGLETVFIRPFESFELVVDSVSQITTLSQFINHAISEKAERPESLSIQLAFPVNGLGESQSILSNSFRISNEELTSILQEYP